ncbi:MAG: hypothetical protein AAFU49_24160, partial [Pseudomonadota bacterium]
MILQRQVSSRQQPFDRTLPHAKIMVETKITSKKENKKVKSPSLSEIAEKEIGDLLKEKIVLKRVG